MTLSRMWDRYYEWHSEWRAKERDVRRICVGAIHTHTHAYDCIVRTSMKSDCLSFTVIHIGRGTNTNQCTIIFLSNTLNWIFLLQVSIDRRPPHTTPLTHTYECEHRKKRCSPNVFFSFRCHFDSKSNGFIFRKIAIRELIFVNLFRC